jgi:2-polyprenyl-3-methyl-5-hydroxy-6-metoxy-1,4-benzoquinol methylase
VSFTVSPTRAPLVCPACGAAGLSRLHRLVTAHPAVGRLHSEVMECARCDHRFLVTSEDQQRSVEAKYHDDYAGFGADAFFARVIREVVAGDLVPRKAPPARVLDVGCGAGEFMQAAVEAGYRVEGVDVSAASAERCRARGLDARAGDFLSMELDGPYDMITLWDVAEHLREPHAFMARARELLAPDGVLVLKIPGFGRRSFTVVGAFNRLGGSVLGAPGHVQYFTPRSLQALLERAGYASVEWLPPRRFRKRPPTRSLRKLAGRGINYVVHNVAGNRNLFVVAHR